MCLCMGSKLEGIIFVIRVRNSMVLVHIRRGFRATHLILFVIGAVVVLRLLLEQWREYFLSISHWLKGVWDKLVQGVGASLYFACI